MKKKKKNKEHNRKTWFDNSSLLQTSGELQGHLGSSESVDFGGASDRSLSMACSLLCFPRHHRTPIPPTPTPRGVPASDNESVRPLGTPRPVYKINRGPARHADLPSIAPSRARRSSAPPHEGKGAPMGWGKHAANLKGAPHKRSTCWGVHAYMCLMILLI